MEEKVILEIDFKSATAQAAELQKTIDALTASMQQLDKATPEYQELNAELKAVRAEQGQLITTATKLIEVQNTQDGSLKQLRAQLRQQEIAYSNLSRAERENGAEGERLKVSINSIRDELKKAEGGIGDFRRQVGDYRNAIKDAGNELLNQSPILKQIVQIYQSSSIILKGVVAGYNALTAATTFNTGTNQAAAVAQAELVSAQLAATAANLALTAAQTAAAVAGGELALAEQAAAVATTELAISEAAAGLAAAQAAVATTTAAVAAAELTATNAAATVATATLAASEVTATGASLGLAAGVNVAGAALRFALLGPIILVVGAIAGLIAYFTKTKEGSDKFAQGMAYLGGVFSALIKSLAEFGKVIFEAFTNPKKLLDLLVENFVNRFKALGDAALALGDLLKGVFTFDQKLAAKGLEDFGRSQIQLITGLSKENQKAIAATAKAAGEAAADAERRTQKVQDRIRELLKVNADLKNEVEKNDKLSDNAGLTFEKRQQAASKAIATQKQLNANNLAVLQEQLKIAQIKQGIEGKTTANMDEIAKIQGEMTSALQEGNTKIYDLENKQAGIRQSAIAAKLNGEKAGLEAQLILVKGNADEELKIKKQLIDKNAELAKNAAGLSAEQLALIDVKATAEKEALNKEYLINRVKDANEAANIEIQNQLNAVKKGSLEEIQLLDKQADILRNQQLALAELEITDATDLVNKKAAIESQYQKTKIDLTKQGLDAIKKLEEQKFNNEIATLKLRASNEQLDQQQRIAAQVAINEQEKQRRIDNAAVSGESVANIQEEFRQKDVELSKQADEQKFAETQQISEATFGFITQLNDLAYKADLEAAGDNQQEKEKIEKEYAARQKRLKLFEILLNQSVAIAKTLAETPFPVSIGAAIAIGAQIAALAGQVIALKFNKGGYVPGSGDTDTVPALLTPGEVVINKRAARANMGLLDSINRSTGGAALIPQRLNSGGIVLPVSGGSQGLSANDVAQIVQSMPSPVVEVKQIIRGINNQVNVTQSATI
jgi:hypothetical protein